MAESKHNRSLPAGKTLVVGIGEVGGALAEVLERKMPVLRHDLERVEFDESIGIMHLCIPFSSPSVFEDTACSYISRFHPSLTIINSTVVPGTTRSIAEKTKTAVAFSPVRGKHVHMSKDLLHYTKFVAAPEQSAAMLACKHFEYFGLRSAPMKKVETLELAKLAETTYFGIQIAFAQEINRYANAVGADYFEATDFFEEIDFLPRTKYFPGFIGGHCVVPNIQLLKLVRSSKLLDALLDSNDRRREELSREARSERLEHGPEADDRSSN